MRSEILRLQKEYKITTIYVTHDQAEALSMSDRIAVFNFGVCHQVGTPSEIYNEPANDFVASFIGEINLLPANINRIESNNVWVSAQVGTGLQELAVNNHPYNFNADTKGELALSIRPEAIRILEAPADGTNILKGKIEKVEFFGSVINLSVNIEGLLLQVNLLNNQSHHLKTGADVFVQLPEDRIRIIPVLSGESS
jgi:iron(III) transport system ATP-binding protein